MNILLMFILLIVSLVSGMMTSSLFSQGWEKQAEGLATRWQKIDAVDSNVAVAIAWVKNPGGGGGIFRTLNGGKTWHGIPWIQKGLLNLSITDSLRIWVATSDTLIYHTSDAGKNWVLQYKLNVSHIFY